MRILIVGHEIDRVEYHLFRRLRESGMEIEICCSPGSPWLPELSGLGVVAEPLEVRSKFDLTAVRYLRRRLRAGGIDVVYALTARAVLAANLATCGLKVPVVAYRGTAGHLSWFDPTSWLGFLNPRLAKIVCVSRAVEQYMRARGVPAERLLTVYKGHDPAWYEATPVPLAEFGIPVGALVIGCVANMRPVKGVDVLIDAFNRLAAREERAHLLLVGEVRDGAVRAAWEASPAASRIHLTGFRADAPAVMGGVDIFVMPSRAREGLPKAALEAMAQGVPPVVSNVGGLPELVVDGESGLVIPPGEGATLAEAILVLARDTALRARLAAGARARISGEFHIDRTVKAMSSLFEELAARYSCNQASRARGLRSPMTMR